MFSIGSKFCVFSSLVAFLTLSHVEVSAQLLQPGFEEELLRSHQSSFNGGTLRDTLAALSSATDIPVWLDRRVDSGQEMKVPNAGPDVESAFQAVAAAADLVSLPLDRLVLVGRPEWVDRTGALILAAGSNAAPSGTSGTAGPRRAAVSKENAIAMEWPFLTSSNEALQIVGDRMQVDVGSVQLPHDLWPAFQASAIRPSTILTLIGCEFDLWIRIDSDGKLRSSELPNLAAIEMPYPHNVVERARVQLMGMTPVPELSRQGDQTVVRGSPRVHRALQQRMAAAKMASSALADNPNRPGRRRVQGKPIVQYTLTWPNAPAGMAFQKLAEAGKLQLSIDPEVEESMDDRVQLDVKELTLPEVVQQIAEQVGVEVEVTPTNLYVRKKAGSVPNP